jgi:hypothetical protein
MTKRKVSKTPTKSQRPAVGRQRNAGKSNARHRGAYIGQQQNSQKAPGPVDAEIRRAAERAGIRRGHGEPPIDGRAEFTDAYVRIVTRHTAGPEEAAYLLKCEAERLQKEAYRLQPRASTNNSLCRNGKAFDGAEDLDPNATIGDLIALLFEAPNRRSQGLLSDLLLCHADEASLFSLVADNDDGMAGGVIERMALRMEWRTKIVIELDKRMRAAEQAAGGAS